MVKKNQIKYGELTKVVLKHIVDSILAGYCAIERRKGASLSDIVDGVINLAKRIKKYQINRAQVVRTLKNLEKKEIVDLEVKEDKVFVHIKNKNHPKIIEYSITSLLDFKKKKRRWDGKWFLVFFDVPETQRNKRDYLRNFLKKIGFYQYQKSVYLFPYECEHEITLIKKIVEGAKYMKYIIAEKIEDESLAKNFFHLA